MVYPDNITTPYEIGEYKAKYYQFYLLNRHHALHEIPFKGFNRKNRLQNAFMEYYTIIDRNGFVTNGKKMFLRTYYNDINQSNPVPIYTFDNYKVITRWCDEHHLDVTKTSLKDIEEFIVMSNLLRT